MNMSSAVFPILPALAMFLSVLIFLEMGRRIGVKRLDVPGARTGVGVVDGSVYALVALLIGFSFNGAAGRFDQRRMLVGETTNSAGTAWQRIDMLPPALQPPVRDGMRRYIDALIAEYGSAAWTTGSTPERAALTRAQNSLWSSSVAACLLPEGEKARMLLLPSLNEMFGNVEKEQQARNLHPPQLIYFVLIVATLIGAIFMGYAIATVNKRNWIYMLGIAGTLASATYVIAELEYPRQGRGRMDATDRTLSELRTTMDPE